MAEQFMTKALTSGIHHVGLTVSKLEDSAGFFTHILGWKEVKRRDDYPAIFVSDGSIMLTLWAVTEKPETAFNRKTNVGLHHLALHVDSEETLNSIHQKLLENKIEIEFSPEFLQNGPAKHMMCFDPSGIRVEFIWLGQ